MKFQYILNKRFGLFVILLGLMVLFYFKNKHEFRYFHVDCEIYDRESKLIYIQDNHVLCDFARNGYVVAVRYMQKLSLFDEKNNLVWSADEPAHHNVRFSNDQKEILLITANFFKFKNVDVKGDCVSVRNLKNEILKKWCLSDHINELQDRGFEFFIKPPSTEGYVEMSHANSIFEIDDNESAKIHPAFKKGNYLVNFFIPSMALLILDRDMKTILWSKNLKKFPYGGTTVQLNTHDNQVDKNGNIVCFVNYMFFSKKVEKNIYDFFNLGLLFTEFLPPRDKYSMLLEYNPFTDQIVWQHTEFIREKFYTRILGTFTKLENGHFLYSDYTNLGRAYEIDESGKRIWEFTNPNNIKTFLWVKPFYNDDFLEARNLL